MSSDRRSLSANTLAQAAPQLLAYFFSFASAPVVLGALGLRNFGIWALTGALAQYAGLLDLGIGRSLTRFIALYDAERNRRGIGECMTVGLLSVPVAGGGLVLAGWASAPSLASRMGIDTREMRILLVSAATMLTASMASSVLVSYPVGLRSMVRPNVGLSISAAIIFAFSVGAALLRPDLASYAVANAIAAQIGLAVVAVTVLSGGVPPLARPTLAGARHLLSFSLKTQIVWLSALVNFQTDKIVIALFIGPRAAGSFELANRVAAAARSIGVLAISAMIPTMTANVVRAGTASLISSYQRLTERTAALSFPSLMLVIGLAPILLRSWVGQTPANSVVVLAALAFAYLPGVATGVGYAIANAAGEPGLAATAAVATAVANATLTLVLTPILGIWGVLAGTIVALTLGALFQVILVDRRLGLPSISFFKGISIPLALSTGCALPVALASYAAMATSREVAVVVVACCSSFYLLSYAIAARRLGILPDALSRRLRFRWRLTRAG